MVKIDVEAIDVHAANTEYIVVFIASFTLGLLILYVVWRKLSKNGSNPFRDDFITPAKPIECNQTKRDAVLKQGFRPERVPDDLDAIVIGSGMGGLICAGCLSRAGKKVLVLEQHDRAGGSTHTYQEKGFEFDIGLHYLGEMKPGLMDHTLFDVMTDGQLVWDEMDKEYDHVMFQGKDGEEKCFKVISGEGEMEKRLLQYFPDEKKAITEFMALCAQSEKAIVGYTMMKQLPTWIVRCLQKTGLFNVLFSRYDYMTGTSTKEALDKLTDNEDLKMVLSYCFGDYGTFPSEAPLLMHGILFNYFCNGAFYPRGGSSELAFHMIPGIERSGGAVLVRAPVSRILFTDAKASGVSVMRNGNEFEIHAPIVISSAGLLNTYNNLIPQTICSKFDVKAVCSKVDQGLACFQVLVGLRGTSEDLNLKKVNYWMFKTPHAERDMKNFLSLPRDEAVNCEVPIVFASFPSTKDSTWKMRYPDKSVCVIVTFLKWEWFEEWEDERVMKRGHVYDDLKKTFQDTVWKKVLSVHPQLKDKVEFIDSGTPLSHKYYLGSPKGDIYGIDHTMKRFQYELGTELRAKTKIPGLYLTGQDSFTCGISGAALSGMITSGAILGRNHFVDLFSLMAKRKIRKKFKKM